MQSITFESNMSSSALGSIPRTQKAIIAKEKIGNPVILTSRPVPTPQNGEVLLKITVAALNPYDKRVRDMGLYVESRISSDEGVVLCNDMAGIVIAFGPDTETHGLKIGDHVFGQTNYLKASNDQCGLQEYAVLDAYTVAKVPDRLNDDVAASCVTNIVSPFMGIFRGDGLGFTFPFPGTEDEKISYPNVTLVILGAGSNCGKFAVQLSKLAGFGRVVVTADKAKNEKLLRGFGATHVIDRHGTEEEVEARIRAIVGNDLVYALDCVHSNHNLGLSILSTKKRGTLACLVPDWHNDLKFGEKENGYEEIFVQGMSHSQPELGRRLWECIPRWIDEGKLKGPNWDIMEGFDVEAVNAVLDIYKTGAPEKQVHVYPNGKEIVK